MFSFIYYQYSETLVRTHFITFVQLFVAKQHRDKLPPSQNGAGKNKAA